MDTDTLLVFSRGEHLLAYGWSGFSHWQGEDVLRKLHASRQLELLRGMADLDKFGNFSGKATAFIHSVNCRPLLPE